MKKAYEFCIDDYRELISEYAPCMNDFLYVFDIKNDIYCISEPAMDRFAIPDTTFTNVEETHITFVYPDDQNMLQEDLHQIVSGAKDWHDITYRWLGRDGQPIWINCRGRSIRNEKGEPAFLIGCINEVGKRSLADNVSGLLESTAIKENWEQFSQNFPKGFMLRIGIDDFKVINEKAGIDYGDYVLRGVADCAVQALMPGQDVYRVVSDEFMIVDNNGGTEQDAGALYRRIRNLIDTFIRNNNYESVFTVSGGIIIGEDMEGMSYNDIMKISQFALNEAKLRGKNQAYCFSAEDYTAFLRRHSILEDMRKSISLGFEGFDVYFQPIIRVGSPTLYAAESLMRYKTSEGEMISPVEFIPILEESGLIIPVGRWVLGRALSMCRECQKTYPEFKVSVNLSYIQILKSDVYDEIVRTLEQYELKPESLIVELTESGYVETTPAVMKLWGRLREYGVMIAIDDFGTGYSNLQSISNMMPNIVKLDRGFTVKALKNSYEHTLMTHIIQLVHSIDLKICVEGVETGEELAEIEKLSADCIQGYYYGRPCCREEFFEKFITE